MIIIKIGTISTSLLVITGIIFIFQKHTVNRTQLTVCSVNLLYAVLLWANGEMHIVNSAFSYSMHIRN
jgi:hypothetical protein